jgi:tRNA-2-methylthio-N6-dimethylallyladenosine synthase
MGRKYDFNHYLLLVEKLRRAVPDISLTTDLIVGFPTETAEEYQMTLTAVNEIKFDAAFMFRYSVREGTVAAKMPDDIPEDIKIGRLSELIELQKEIALKKNQQEIGLVRSVLIDNYSRRDKKVLKGKTEGNKTILIKGTPDLIGTIQNVIVESADSWTLWGKRVS